MAITLVLHGEARQFSGGKRTIQLAADVRTVREIVDRAGIPLAETAAFVVNGEQADADAPVRDGDTVEVLPAISGGAP